MDVEMMQHIEPERAVSRVQSSHKGRYIYKIGERSSSPVIKSDENLITTDIAISLICDNAVVMIRAYNYLCICWFVVLNITKGWKEWRKEGMVWGKNEGMDGLNKRMEDGWMNWLKKEWRNRWIKDKKRVEGWIEKNGWLDRLKTNERVNWWVKKEWMDGWVDSVKKDWRDE